MRVLFVGDEPVAERFRPVAMPLDEPRPRNKPCGGLWTCRETRRGYSAWADWCSVSMPDRRPDASLWRLVAERPRMLKLDGVAALADALERYPHRWFADQPEIDFAAVAERYDAVELTERGLIATRFALDLALYGWDVPTVLWLRWAFAGVERVSQLTDMTATAAPRGARLGGR